MPTQPEKHCHYCVNNIDVDYRDAQTLQRFMSHFARIMPAHRTGLCAKHQSQIARAIKRARELGFLPYIRK